MKDEPKRAFDEWKSNEILPCDIEETSIPGLIDILNPATYTIAYRGCEIGNRDVSLEKPITYMLAANGLFKVSSGRHLSVRIPVAKWSRLLPGLARMGGCLALPTTGRISADLLDICLEHARREITAWRAGHYRDNRVWWLDGGNHRDGGQVHIGNGDEVVISPFGFCSHLPAPDLQAPDLVVDTVQGMPALGLESGPAALADLSCAELAALDAQSLMVNQVIAGWMATYLYRLLITRDLDIMATYVDLVTGSVRSEPITDPADEEE